MLTRSVGNFIAFSSNNVKIPHVNQKQEKKNDTQQ